MKKNKMMRTASGLLIATLVTTSIISGTLAKYTTSGSAQDNARVAKFGVVINASGSLYSDAYDGGADSGKPAATYANNHMTVASATAGDDVVAPGTKSNDDGLNFAVSGTPEVAVTVGATIKAKDIFLKEGYTYAVMTAADVSRESFVTDGSLYTKTDAAYTQVTTGNYDSNATYYKISSEVEVADAAYYPVKYALTGTTNNTTETDKTANKAAGLLAKAVNGGTDVTGTLDADTQVTTYTVAESTSTTAGGNVYAPNTDLATAGPKLGDENLTWAWDFPTTADEATDKKDTILGDMMAASGVTTGQTYYVVAKATGGNYSDVTYDDTNKLAKSGDVVIASLQTSFDIKLTVTQVD